MQSTTTLSSKFQISIPKAVRDRQCWKAGQEFVFIPKGKGVLVMPVPEFEQLAGLAKGADKKGYRDRNEPRRDFRRLFGLSHAAIGSAACCR